MPRFLVSLVGGLALAVILAVGLAVVLASGPVPAGATSPSSTPGHGVDPQLAAAADRDGPALRRLLRSSRRAATAAAHDQRTLPPLVAHARKATAGVRAGEDPVSDALRLLPGTLTRSGATMSALRKTLDDLDPVVVAALPATAGLAPLLRRLRGVVREATPTVSGLRTLVRASKPDDDLHDLLRQAPDLADRIVPALQHTAGAARDSRPIATALAPVVPDGLGVLRGFNRASRSFDANGRVVDVAPLVPAGTLVTDPTAAGP